MPIFLNFSTEISLEQFCDFVLEVMVFMKENTMPPPSFTQIMDALDGEDKKQIIIYDLVNLKAALKKMVEDGLISCEVAKGEKLYSLL